MEDDEFRDLLTRYQALVPPQPTGTLPQLAGQVPRELWIGSEFADTELYVDGLFVGYAPIVLPDPPAGPVRLEARSDEVSVSRSIVPATAGRTEIFLRIGEFERVAEESLVAPLDQPVNLAPTPAPLASVPSAVAAVPRQLPPPPAPADLGTESVDQRVVAERYVALRALEESLSRRYQERVQITSRRRALSWGSFGLAATGAVVAGAGFGLAAQSYADYLAAETEPAAEAARAETERMTMVLSAGALSAAGGVVTGLLFRLFSREPADIRRELERTRAERTGLRADHLRAPDMPGLEVSIDE